MACDFCGEDRELRVLDRDGYAPDGHTCRECWDAGEPDTGQPDFDDLPKLNPHSRG